MGMGRTQRKLFQSTSPVRGTTRTVPTQFRDVGISIHVPREGDDELKQLITIKQFTFQSTSPVRGTTRASAGKIKITQISIHVPREGDDRLSKKSSLCWAFSIFYDIIIMGDEKCLNEEKWSVEFMKL